MDMDRGCGVDPNAVTECHRPPRMVYCPYGFLFLYMRILVVYTFLLLLAGSSVARSQAACSVADGNREKERERETKYVRTQVLYVGRDKSKQANKQTKALRVSVHDGPLC